MASVDRGVCFGRGGAKSQKSGEGARKTSGKEGEHHRRVKIRIEGGRRVRTHGKDESLLLYLRWHMFVA